MNDLINAIIAGERQKAKAITESIIEEDSAYEIITNSISKAMEVVGQRYETGEYFIPEMIRSAKCAELAFSILKPHIRLESVQEGKKVVIGTVKGDVHDIGKNIMKSVLECSGFTVYDLGVNVHPKQFIDKIIETGSTLLLLSALTTATSLAMQEVLSELVRLGMRERVKVLVGGVSVSESFARSIGADYYGSSIKETLEFCKSVPNSV
ncbi:MAG: cobalamin-dependent protein [Candidatus Woesearchaeota archaeon]